MSSHSHQRGGQKPPTPLQHQLKTPKKSAKVESDDSDQESSSTNSAPDGKSGTHISEDLEIEDIKLDAPRFVRRDTPFANLGSSELDLDDEENDDLDATVTRERKDATVKRASTDSRSSIMPKSSTDPFEVPSLRRSSSDLTELSKKEPDLSKSGVDRATSLPISKLAKHHLFSRIRPKLIAGHRYPYEFEDVMGSISLFQRRIRGRRKQSERMSLLFSGPSDDLQHYQRTKTLKRTDNADFKHLKRRLVKLVPDKPKKPKPRAPVRRAASQRHVRFDESKNTSADASPLTSPASPKIFTPLPPASKGIIRKNLIFETLEQSFSRIFQERQRWEQRFLSYISQGHWLTHYVDSRKPGQERFVIVSKDGAEIAWGKDKDRVQTEISHKRASILSMLFGGKPAQLRFLADAEKVVYGVDHTDAFNHLIRNDGCPWRCFTLCFEPEEEGKMQSEVHFTCPDDESAKNWFMGLQSLIPLNTQYRTLGSFLWMRARMRTIYLARHRAGGGIPREIVTELWERFSRRSVVPARNGHMLRMEDVRMHAASDAGASVAPAASLRPVPTISSLRRRHSEAALDQPKNLEEDSD